MTEQHTSYPGQFLSQGEDPDVFVRAKPSKNFFTEQKQDKMCKRKLRPSMTAAQI